ncbi:MULTISPECIES: heme biosynthesis protein HemY [unclassified Acinetobacter]|uniref:heme biosynthesis protein HemY n=1 Tax=unclassified Acinetobacter TaxID=196816 RepID=UPI002934963E|nr:MULTISPECIES: heme biosynthesis protein HemY [unclassified Acinetobacter]WOE30648.1 heme biosynthesis protein HemY [Acinetobacter sp. SAAs470]WOE38840.1 heme biosynthesis protein HemY [Acinetobacter sp. SAAs474]
MKTIFLTYLLLSLFLIALLSVFSYGYSAGYVYIYWRDIQLQTTIWGLTFLLIIVSLTLHIIVRTLKVYIYKERRKTETILDFSSLHPYEQLTVILLLDAEKEQKDFVSQIFTQSGLLKGVMDSHLYFIQQDFSQALHALDHTNIMAFELAELQRIKIYLAQGEAEKALTHLQFLDQHQLSPWLNDVKAAYQIKLIDLWGEFALHYPWLYLTAASSTALKASIKIKWLELILSHFDQADREDIQRLKQYYLNLKDNFAQQSYEIRVLWLKILSRLTEFNDEYEQLVIALLNEKFDQDVFYLWFQQQILKGNPNYADIEQRIYAWEDKYLTMPIFSFVKWHLYMATQRYEEANQLLDLYPDNVLMSYLRIKSKLQDQDDLVQQLNIVFQNNSNYLEIKI